MLTLFGDWVKSQPGELEQFVIYKNVSDRPEEFVVRRWVVSAGRATPLEAFGFSTLTEARAAIPSGTACITRMADDDPVVVEVWL